MHLPKLKIPIVLLSMVLMVSMVVFPVLAVETSNDGTSQKTTVTAIGEDIPTATIKIIEGSERVDVAEVGISDTVDYELTGTLPSNLGSYKSYYYQFHNEIESGLGILEDTVKVTVDGVDVTNQAKIKVHKPYIEGDSTDVLHPEGLDYCSMDIIIDDLLSLGGVEITTDSIVKVSYSAKVQVSDLVTFENGNPNTVYLEFSNNPSGDNTGKTSVDKASVFTFALYVGMTDGTFEHLPGAEFTLQRQQEDGSFADVQTDYSVYMGTEFAFRGIDSGVYKLIESTVPNGYHKANDIVFEIRAEYDTDSDDPLLTNLSVWQNGKDVSIGGNADFEINRTNCAINATVINVTVDYSLIYLLCVGTGILWIGTVIWACIRHKKKS